jgi:enoyl-[acyl-carrier protein] reductase I
MSDDGALRLELPALLAERRGLVLGVSSENSVGFQLARHLQALGAEVAASLRPNRGRFVSQLSELGIFGVELDAMDETSVERAVLRAGERFERLDFIVHGLVHVPDGALTRPVQQLSARELGDAMEVGVRSLLVAARVAQPLLKRSDAPRIVTLLSGGAELAMPAYHVVGMVKAALGAAMRYLAAELGPVGILCNAVSFSILETDAARRVIGPERTQQTRQHLSKRSMTQRPLSFTDVAQAVAFLASPLCSNLTGEVLTVDGGFSKSYF